MSRPARIISLGLLLVAVAIAVRLGSLGGHGHAHVQMTSKASAARLARAPSSPAAAGASPRQRMSAADVQRAFVRSYLSYLSGSLPASRLPYASITAHDQAATGGRIPASFRDGPLEVRAIAGEGSTLYSAQATIDAGNRAESYPFTVALLREHNEWQVAQVQPPDLSVDQHTRPVGSLEIPRAGQLAAKDFAVRYVDYRAAVKPGLVGMTSTAEGELRDGEDSLAPMRLPRARARLLALSYGPLEQDRFAVTATVGLRGRRVRFTVLMFDSGRGWECDAFL
jgi:hypothetical protein